MQSLQLTSDVNHPGKPFCQGELHKVGCPGDCIHVLGPINGEELWLTLFGHFRSPVGVAVDEGGNIMVVESYNCRVQKFTCEGQLWNYGYQITQVNNVTMKF